jgi:voltage-gated potassium channel
MAENQNADLSRFGGRPPASRSTLRRFAKASGAESWFPQVPLFLGLAAAGAVLLLSASGEGRRVLVSADIINDTVASLGRGSHLVPAILLGFAMLVMSAGLLLRSRFAWVVSLLLTSGALLVAVRYRHSTFGGLAYFYAALLVALVLGHRSFNRSSIAAASMFAVVSGLMLLTYAIFGTYYLGAEFKPPVRDIGTALYYSVVTMSTVGYGDIVPQTLRARLFAISLIILGITIFATSISAIIGPIISGSMQRILKGKEKRMNRKDHYVIIGQTSLATNTYRELRKRNQPVTVILVDPPSSNDFADADVIVGDATDLDVLRKAGADVAHAVLAMRPDDSENAFIVLAVKELGGTAKTVAAVNDSKHVTRVKRVHPDIIIAPQVLGGELLAMALSGESISGEFVRDRFLHFETSRDAPRSGTD